MASKWDEFEARIRAILGQQGSDHLVTSNEHLQVYLEYLQNNLEQPCLVTGTEDFPWEERYVFGYGEEKEYEELKKTQPSYTDIYTLVELELTPDLERLFAIVERITDKKEFSLPLEDLEAKSKLSPNYQLLDDYSAWYVNYQ